MFKRENKNINIVDKHIAEIKAVIQLMQSELTKNNGKCGGQIHFGDYTSPIAPFADGHDWLTNRYKPQSFLSVFAILELGINQHQRRIEILEQIKNNEYINTEEHLLLLKVKALDRDPFIENYERVYISRNVNPQI